MLLRIRLFKPVGSERICVVATTPAFNKPGAFLIQVSRGVRIGKLQQSAVFGPFAEAELQARFDEVIAKLKSEGYSENAPNLLLNDLQSKSPKVRARAAQRLGWMKCKQAVSPLVAALPDAVDDACSLVDALGEIGDPKAIAAIRPYAERKLLSRRRSGVEALRKLKDAAGLAEARQRGAERLDAALKAALGTVDELDPKAAAPLVKVLLGTHPKDRGPALDVLYEIGTPAAVAATLEALAQTDIGKPGMWRYAKSILKRAMLRHDFAMVGWLVHAVERHARTTPGTFADVKSGYDGKTKKSPIFRRKTQNFVRRLGWRYLRRLAKWRPDDYAFAAAEAVVGYTSTDARTPRGLRGAWGSAYLLHRVLWGASSRLRVDSRSLNAYFRSHKVVAAPPGVREESFPELWDAQPLAYLRLLAAGKLPEVHELAHAALKRHPRLIEKAGVDDLHGMLEAPHEPTVALALSEFSRRFDAAHPDWRLLDKLLSSPMPAAQELALSWLKLTAHLWTRDVQRLVWLLDSKDARVRTLCTELTLVALQGGDALLRERLAEKLLEILRSPEKEAGDHDRFVRLATEGVGRELSARLPTEELMAFIAKGTLAAKSVAGYVLGTRPEAFQQLGMDTVLPLARHEVAAVRAASLQLIRSVLSSLRDDPRILFALAESEWPDTRAGAVKMLREIDLGRLGLEGVVGLCDSNYREVQDFGRDLAIQQLGSLDPRELLFRLSQHPHRNIQDFALDLVELHLHDSVPLDKLEGFARTALFDVWPDRRMKRRVLELLRTRGLKDPEQAKTAAAILGDFVRTATRADFERAAQALVQLKLANPALSTAIAVPEAGPAKAQGAVA